MSRESVRAMAELHRKTTRGWGYRFILNDRVRGARGIRFHREDQEGTVIDMFCRPKVAGTPHYVVRWNDGTTETHYGESLMLIAEPMKGTVRQ